MQRLLSGGGVRQYNRGKGVVKGERNKRKVD